MRRPIISLILLLAFGIVAAQSDPGAETGHEYTEDGFYAGLEHLTHSERNGREIWYKATAGNDRFHTYVFQQRLGVLIDWYRVLNSADRSERFNVWGLINDPSCCTPGSERCPARSAAETYGLDYCPGDDELLKYVGREGYRDPACDLDDSPLRPDHPHGPEEYRQSSCDLAFGTSTGALGLRKFPNPRFDKNRWRELNDDKLDSWDGYNKRLSSDSDNSDSRVSHMNDASIEPPFYIGMACGACHIAYDPTNPPADPNAPRWENILGTIGNQYTRMSEIMASGMPADSMEWQIFSHARPGTVDTSAVPNDQVNNPGTMNALINLERRPLFVGEEIVKWRPESSCDESNPNCWCEAGRSNKCWVKSKQTETVHHILKGGGDSIGALEAIQRVYINIGSCSEACWVNHLTDTWQLDPTQRNYGQTPFDIGQCRRDCPNFRAIEDRLPEIRDFLFSSKANSAPLYKARQLESHDELVAELDSRYGENSVSRGRDIFAASCARCHSSQSAPFETTDFFASTGDAGLRDDWMGNDESTPASEVGTFRCRALHSNHMEGHIFQEYASETYRARAADATLAEENGGGRGYYRNISLLNAWAHAPFMHNNAIGPELCGQPSDPKKEFYRPPYKVANPPACVKFNPSVDGRFRVFESSMDLLLSPDKRIPKVSVQDQPIRFDVGPRTWDGDAERKLAGVELELPAGTPAGLFGGFRHKQLVGDIILSLADRDRLRSNLEARVSADRVLPVMEMLDDLRSQALRNPDQILTAAKEQQLLLLETYSNCTAQLENVGHRFGEDLSDEDKKALTAFVATL